MAGCDEEPLGRMIYFMALDIRNLAEKVLAPYELTLEQFQTLKILSSDTGLTQRQLGQQTNKNPANMTRILDRLELKSLLARRTDPNDRRVYLVYLTDRGQSLLDDVMGVFELFSVRLHKGITTEMQQMARKVLRIMAANIGAMSAGLEKKPER
jgi:MarR family transcriptional regulator for hemolysin